jgi:hypothetical protein
MTWLNLKLNDVGMTLLTSVGISLAVPILLPVAGAVLRPVLKEVIRASLFVADTLSEMTTESREQLSDLIVEAKTEYEAGVNSQAG